MEGAKKPRIKTFARKSLDKKKNKGAPTSYVQYRCNVFVFANSMELYKLMLEECKDVCDQLAKTRFWSLIKLYMDDHIIATQRKKKSDMDLRQCYDSKQQKFKFRDHKPRGITSEDVTKIFGLNNK
ncbi:hypothetical protein DVH24_015446 [Malus domestica]|uniref:Uncharacterized protein n=1 Tax=Malus domestica TaxID=3750 RepID=A0A498HKI0_MALDO|nr:hypothetical protein DVH24_015446 [Malus domestica]